MLMLIGVSVYIGWPGPTVWTSDEILLTATLAVNFLLLSVSLGYIFADREWHRWAEREENR